MADINNFTEITENFDTIKTLLNSIRAQGILNTSDVDKLLAGINTKLEKINTEEDIDLIKIFLSELKQNLEERHNVLISKFGAIESLFSNLLKNSADSLKSSEVKELFDIVATNLSVFSREVVSQKETLSDIILRIDAMRSDDSQKKEIIKSISFLKSDIERITNGFESIVLSLNENFKTIIKNIASIDPSENLSKFGEELSDIANSSNTILSALQMLDKKSLMIEDALSTLATQDDLIATKKWISDLANHEQELTQSIDNLSDKYYKIDNLADKIDASVDIIANLKSILEESTDEKNSQILDILNSLQTSLTNVTSNQDFEEFKVKFETILKTISSDVINSQSVLTDFSDEIKKISNTLVALDINASFKSLSSELNKSEQNIKEHVNSELDKINQLIDVNAARTLSELSSNADDLGTKFNNAHSLISELCKKSFAEVEENLEGLRAVVVQIDENNVSSNNAIFSNITDRLALFENSLKSSLEKQENFVSTSSSQLLDQVNNIKDLSGILDYKFDANNIQLNEAKKEFSTLKKSIEDVLALNFVSKVQELKGDLGLLKQDLSAVVENSTSVVSDNLTNDLFSKYELLVSKIDSTEKQFKIIQEESLSDMKVVLDNISSSIVDILSYVSTRQGLDTDFIDSKIEALDKVFNDHNLSYIENVRDIVEVIKTQVEENLNAVHSDYVNQFDVVTSCVQASSDNLKSDLKISYEKLLELKDEFEELKDAFNSNKLDFTDDITNVISSTNSIKSDFESKLLILKNSIIDKVAEFQQTFTCENADRLSEIKFASENLHAKSIQNAVDIKQELKGEFEQIIGTLKLNIEELAEQLSSTSFKVEGANTQILGCIRNELSPHVGGAISELETKVTDYSDDIDQKISNVIARFSDFEQGLNSQFENSVGSVKETFAKILENFEILKNVLADFNEKDNEHLKENVALITADFANLCVKVTEIDSNLDEDLSRLLSIIENNFEMLTQTLQLMQSNADANLEGHISKGISSVADTVKQTIVENLGIYKAQVEELFDNISNKNESQAVFIGQKASELNDVLCKTLEHQNEIAVHQLEEISKSLTETLKENINESSLDYMTLKSNIDSFTADLELKNLDFQENLKTQIDSIAQFVDSGLDIQSQNVIDKFSEISDKVTEVVDLLSKNSQLLVDTDSSISTKFVEKSDEISTLLADLSLNIEELSKGISTTIGEKFSETYTQVDGSLSLLSSNVNSSKMSIEAKVKDLNENLVDLRDSISSIIEEFSMNILTQNTNNSSSLIEEYNVKTSEITEAFDNLNSKLDDNQLQFLNILQNQIKDLCTNFTELIEDAKDVTNNSLTSIGETLITNNTSVMNELERIIEEKAGLIMSSNAEIAAGSLTSFEQFSSMITAKTDENMNAVNSCKDFINGFVKTEFNNILKNIEAESDSVVSDLIEQFNMLRESQKDEFAKMTAQIENIVEDHVYANISDLKSYLDIKTDSTVIDSKLDSISNSIIKSAEDMLVVSNKLLENSVFSDAVADIKNTNEIIVSTMAENLNSQLTNFIKQNVTGIVIDKLNLFDKKFTDAVVDKYEELKLVSTESHNAIDKLYISIQNIIDRFEQSKNDIQENILSSLNSMNVSVDNLSKRFADLKAQVLNKSLDEAFQSAINQQIEDIQNLMNKQFSYLEDISDLCSDNLPELTEMNTLVKYNLVESVSKIQKDIEDKDVSIQKELNELKSEVITQFINVFNQISFVTEQEEILDFIQEKHSELITILSHIVNNIDCVSDIKDNVVLVDNKLDNLKDDIDLINEKITSIISSSGDIDYVYSLQDLESDIANLRLSLNEVKQQNNSEELEELIHSTNDIYALVDAIKHEINCFNTEEFRKDFDSLNEDILSISTRTNKLILASDESYKTLQENLQDFKLVINDLDERTRNFAQESGMDKLDNKLCAINNMIQSGAKTNKVFNQVFEYLAEWVDTAGAQITAISDKVETLDDIGQIKVMLEDLKAESEDSTQSEELVQALADIFDKQARKISSLEAKLDRVIVETTIHNKDNQLDITPFEDTLNRFLVAIDDKMLSQQSKIDLLEAKIEDVATMINPKDTAQLTKKVGGMDRQIAKLNKSIEKIASHVIEK